MAKTTRPAFIRGNSRHVAKCLPS